MVEKNPSSPRSRPSHDAVSDFCQAARYGKIDDIREYLDAYGAAIINEQDVIDARAITWAAWAGHEDVVALLLERGADIDAKGTSGRTALGYAVQMGHHDIVIFLLEKGASLNEKDDLGRTALEIAREPYPTIADMIERWVEKERQRVAEEERRKAAAAEKIIRDAAHARIERLKGSRPSAPVLKKNPSKGP